jgi:hypothetical protein
MVVLRVSAEFTASHCCVGHKKDDLKSWGRQAQTDSPRSGGKEQTKEPTMNTPKHSTASWAMVAWALVLASPAYATTVYVSTSGDDANDGLSWATAKRTVQAGLNTAVAGDQVWVAAGTYIENITLKLGVALYGRLAGVENPATFDLDDRHFTAYETILDGNQAGSVVTSPSGATASTRVDGFTIRNGSGTAAPSYTYGGGIYCYSSSPTIANNTIIGNSAIYGGGGIACRSSSSAIIVNNVVKGNRASSGSGGGVYCNSSSPTAVANTIAGNTAASYGGGFFCTVSSSPMVADNAIIGNTAGTGGGFYCSGSSSSPTVANNTIAWNTANFGGGAYYLNSPAPKIANTIIAFNSSGVYFITEPGSTLRYNCVYLNTEYDYSGMSSQTGQNGNISADPRFVRPASPGPDSLWGTADDDYGDLRLQPGSPCGDAGDNAAVPADTADLDGDLNTTEALPLDVGGRTRFADDPAAANTGAGTPPIVDMGAWEYFLALIPDFDWDEDVDQADFGQLQACLSEKGRVDPACQKANLNGDRAVDQKDIALFEGCASGPGVPAKPNCLPR